MKLIKNKYDFIWMMNFMDLLWKKFSWYIMIIKIYKLFIIWEEFYWILYWMIRILIRLWEVKIWLCINVVILIFFLKFVIKNERERKRFVIKLNMKDVFCK